MTSPHLRMAAALLCAAGYQHSAQADDDLTSLLSEPVETTAGKSAGTAASAPALSVSITSEDLRRYGIRTLGEAYNFLTMGLVSQDPLGEPEAGGRGLLFTGDQNKHLLVLIDGHSTNNQESGASLHGRSLGMPLEIIDHIEVVLGPGSVLYGSNAMLGVVNIVTKRAKDYSGIHVIAAGGYHAPMNRAHALATPALKSQYLEDIGQGYRFGLGVGHEFELRGLPAELTAQFEYFTLDGPTMEWTPQIEPQTNFGPRAPRGAWGGFTRNSYYARVPSGYARLIVGDFEASAHVVASRISLPYLPRKNQLTAGDFDDPDGARVRRYAGLELKWRHNVSTVASVLVRLYGDSTTDTFQTHDHSFFGCLDFRPEVFCARTEAGFAHWVGSEMQWTLDWKGNGNMTTMFGADGRVRRVGYQNGSTEVDTGRSLVYSRFSDTETVAAAYVQHVQRLVRSVTVNGGARWDIDGRFGGRLLPRAALIWEPWSGGTLKAIYSQAFRAPTADEIYYRSPLSALVSGGLLPESVRSVEAILQQRFGTQSLVFGVFQSWWTDMIVRRELFSLLGQTPTEGSQLIEAAKRDGLLASTVQVAYQYRNVASIENFGFNGGYEGTLVGARLAYGFNLTAAYARLNSPEGRRRVPVTPSLFGNARISYDLANRLPVMAIAAHFSDRRLADAGEYSGFIPLPYAPAALDLRATVAGPFPRVKRLKYQIMGNYAFAPSGPYTAGPSSVNAETLTAPQLVPTVRFTLMFGLQYDIDFR